MKKKVLLFLTIILLVVFIGLPITRAVTKERSDTVQNKDDNQINNEIFEFQESIGKKNEIINGNTFLMANNITIENETINGDVFILANLVNIAEDVTINGNVYICASNLQINGIINRGLYVLAKDVVLDENALVKYDTNICADHLKINCMLERNVNVAVNNFEIKEYAVILKNLNYTSDKEAMIDKKAEIENISFKKQVVKEKSALDIVYDYVLEFTQYFLLVFVLLILLVKILPNFANKAEKFFTISSFGLGIASIVIIPILILAMILFNYTALIGIVGLVVFIAMLIISQAITDIAIAAKLSKRFTKIKLPISVTLVAIVSWLIYQIPFIGGILAFFMITTGLGIMLKSAFVKTNQ